jgi:adenylate cyclase/guanylate cyclase
VTAKRFITGRENQRAMPRCATAQVQGLYNESLQRDEIPGVYIQATAVNNMLRQDALRELDLWLMPP